MWSPPDQSGYFEQVWTLVRQIPVGCVMSYGQIAQALPVPDGSNPESYRRLGPRWVGRAMRHCPDDVPWWRVINSQGKISLPVDSTAATRQRERLLQEGVQFDERGRVDFKQFGWIPESSET